MSYKPKVGKDYWMLNSRFEVKHTTNTGSKKAQDRIKVGNAFKTAKQANDFRKFITKRSKKQWWEFWK